MLVTSPVELPSLSTYCVSSYVIYANAYSSKSISVDDDTIPCDKAYDSIAAVAAYAQHIPNPP